MVVLVTGGIGSGKSVVCRMLTEKYGIPVYEADSRVKQLYAEHAVLLSEIERTLGVSLRDMNGRFISSLLADIIFKNINALNKVEAVLFPILKNDFREWMGRQECGIVAFESATALEKEQFADLGDLVVLVDAPMEVRLKRAIERDGLSEEAVKARMRTQALMNALSEGRTDPRVDFVLRNDSTQAELETRLADFMAKYGLTKKL